MLLRKVKAVVTAVTDWPASPAEIIEETGCLQTGTAMVASSLFLFLVLHTILWFGSSHTSSKEVTQRGQNTTCFPSVAQIQTRGHGLCRRCKPGPSHTRDFLKFLLQIFWFIFTEAFTGFLEVLEQLSLLIKKVRGVTSYLWPTDFQHSQGEPGTKGDFGDLTLFDLTSKRRGNFLFLRSREIWLEVQLNWKKNLGPMFNKTQQLIESSGNVWVLKPGSWTKSLLQVLLRPRSLPREKCLTEVAGRYVSQQSAGHVGTRTWVQSPAAVWKAGCDAGHK